MTTNKDSSPFHEGELAMQDKAGKREFVASYANKVIRSYMPDQHREFFQQLPFLVIGSVNEAGLPWASIINGNPGFIRSPTSTKLTVDNDLLNTLSTNGDPLADTLTRNGAPVGLLGIELSTRRRNRMNARVTQQENEITFNVDQSFGNCPQYIQTRDIHYIRPPNTRGKQHAAYTFDTLDQAARELIDSADTFFVSSFIQPNDRPDIEGVDVSHRGGKPGFVKRTGNTLTIPDYSGNNHFNTLGNFLINPKAGILFPDFTNGNLLQLTGDVEVLPMDHPEVLTFKRAERAWRFLIKQGRWQKDALPFRGKFNAFSPNIATTGSWKEAHATLEAKQQRNDWHPLKVTKIIKESSQISSFYLKHAQGKALLPFLAGQYLTIKVNSEMDEKDLIRTYTLSSAPHEKAYRITVKRENDGIVSSFLHDSLREGDDVFAKSPLGNFTIDATVKRPAILMGGGVGITPMIAMAKHIIHQGLRTGYTRPLTIFHSAQTLAKRALHDEFKHLETQSDGSFRYYSFLSQPEKEAQQGLAFDFEGHIDANRLRQILPLDDYDVYLCGPSGFMQTIYNELRALAINDSRIHTEEFGSVQVTRQPDTPLATAKTENQGHTIVRFTQSNFEQPWQKGDGTLLELAENHGITPNYGCRNGACGACSVKIQAGDVSYSRQPATDIAPNTALICCATPSKDTELLVLDL